MQPEFWPSRDRQGNSGSYGNSPGLNIALFLRRSHLVSNISYSFGSSAWGLRGFPRRGKRQPPKRSSRFRLHRRTKFIRRRDCHIAQAPETSLRLLPGVGRGRIRHTPPGRAASRSQDFAGVCPIAPAAPAKSWIRGVAFQGCCFVVKAWSRVFSVRTKFVRKAEPRIRIGRPLRLFKCA